MKMKKIEIKRIDWIDTLRGIGMFLVIWGHVFPTNKWRIRRYIYSFHMPLFFFISGLTFKDSDKLSFKDYLKKRIKGLIIPYLAINIVCYIIWAVLFHYNIVIDFDALDYFFGIFVSHATLVPCAGSQTWFIITLFISEIIFYFLKKYSTNDFNLGICVSISGLIGYVISVSGYNDPIPFHLNTVFTAIVFYYLGYLFMKYINKFKVIFNNKMIMLISGGALGIIGFITQFFNRRVSMYSNLYGSFVLFYISSLCTIIALIIFVNLFMKKSKFFKGIGQNTLFYLGYHYSFILVVLYLYKKIFTTNLGMLGLSIVLTIFMYPFALLVKKYIPILIGKVNIKSLN